MKSLYRSLVGVAVAVGAAAGGGAAAQEARTDNEVVVTAQKRSENIQEVPIAITSLSADDLKERDVNGVRDLVTQIPAVNFGEVAGTTQVSARGIGFGLLTGVGENSVATHRDGMYIPRPGAAGMLFDDAGRIEFLRGPQGTLYGRNATGGVLNLVSPTPPDAFEANFSVAAGNYGALRTSAAMGGPLTENIRARAFIQRDEHDGYVLNTATGQRLDDLSRWTGHVAVDIDLSEKLSVEARAFSVQDEFAGPIYDPIDPSGSPDNPLPSSTFDIRPFKVFADAEYGSSRTVAGGVVKVAYDFGPARLVSITGYQHYKFFTRNYDGDGTILSLFNVTRPEESHSLSQEFNLIGSTGDVDWVVGAYYLSDRDKIQFFTATPGFVGVGIESLYQALNDHSQYTSAFADVTWKATDRFAIYGGLRVQKEDRTGELGNLLNLVGGITLPICTPSTPGGTLEIDKTTTTGRAGVRFSVNDDQNLYAQYSRGSKSGGFGASSCGNPYESEQIDAFEVGWKTMFLDRTLRFNAAAYYYDFKDLQVEQIIGTSLFIRNAPASTVYGVEAELNWQPDDHWEFNVTGAALRARYDEFSDVDPFRPGLGTIDLSGNRLSRAPDWTLNVGGQYSFNLADLGTLRPRVEVYATDKYALRPYQASEADFQASYTTLGASLTWISPDDAWSLRAYGRNLTNEAYLQGMVANPGEGRLGVYAPPRTYGIELSAKF